MNDKTREELLGSQIEYAHRLSDEFGKLNIDNVTVFAVLECLSAAGVMLTGDLSDISGLANDQYLYQQFGEDAKNPLGPEERVLFVDRMRSTLRFVYEMNFLDSFEDEDLDVVLDPLPDNWSSDTH